jgi:hypothetical protein
MYGLYKYVQWWIHLSLIDLVFGREHDHWAKIIMCTIDTQMVVSLDIFSRWKCLVPTLFAISNFFKSRQSNIASNITLFHMNSGA